MLIIPSNEIESTFEGQPLLQSPLLYPPIGGTEGDEEEAGVENDAWS